MQIRNSVGVAAVLLALITASGTGCANKTRTGALVGTGAGAGVGAIIGHQIGKEKEGAAIGAALGAASGALIGRKQDAQDEHDAMTRNVAHQEAEHQAQLRAMSNYDVVEMTKSSISDAVIISTIQDRGANFDTSPTAIIGMKQEGVSDTLIMAMQRHNHTK